jgi:hypothetical protein
MRTQTASEESSCEESISRIFFQRGDARQGRQDQGSGADAVRNRAQRGF